jgi:hypothetical protein
MSDDCLVLPPDFLPKHRSDLWCVYTSNHVVNIIPNGSNCEFKKIRISLFRLGH